MKLDILFSHFARAASDRVSRPGSFVCAIFIFIAWLISGPYFHFSIPWITGIDTFIGIVTFLMVMLLQHSQNHDTRAIQMKLDELIHSHARAANDLIEIEKLSTAEVESIREEQHKKARGYKTRNR